MNKANADYLNSCRSCWWQEGGRCYVGTPERDANGVSKVIAETKCIRYLNKRVALSSVIPNEKLTIMSEVNV